MAAAGGAWSKGGKFTMNKSRVNTIKVARRQTSIKKQQPRADANWRKLTG